MVKREIKPIQYTTVNKLISGGRLRESDLLGDKLKSDVAKELYKENIRVHHKHYIPKDSKKYFHEQEISGGSFKSAFKKIGTVAKHTVSTIGNTAQMGIDAVNTGFIKPIETAIINPVSNFVESAIDSVEAYKKDVINGRTDYPPKVRTIIKAVGDIPITSIQIVRTPVQSILIKILNALSGGRFKQKLSETPYNKLYHLFIIATLNDGKKVSLEKNEVINMDTGADTRGGETMDMSNIPSDLTINKLLQAGLEVQGNKFYDYSAYDNNCQDFIIAITSKIATPEEKTFIKQDVKQLFTPGLRKIANTATKAGAVVNTITTGSGMKEFKPKRNKKELYKMRKYQSYDDDESDSDIEGQGMKHMLYHSSGDPSSMMGRGFKPKHLLYHSSGDPSSMMGRGFKPKDMLYHSSGDPSSMVGRGARREREIIKKIEKIADEIHEHQHMHGGKIHIAGAFKKLGSTIKSGFESTPVQYLTGGVPLDVLRDAGQATGKYITSKKGGLASDLITYGVPAANSAIFGALGEMAGGPLGGVAGSAAGAKLGDYEARKLHSATGSGFKKGSPEAKAHMSKIRAMKKK